MILFFCILKIQTLSTRLSILQKTSLITTQKYATLDTEHSNLKIQLAKTTSELQAEHRGRQEKLTLLEKAKGQLSLQFRELAQRIFEEKMKNSVKTTERA